MIVKKSMKLYAFRLTEADRAALNALAEREQLNTADVLRRLIRATARCHGLLPAEPPIIARPAHPEFPLCAEDL